MNCSTCRFWKESPAAVTAASASMRIGETRPAGEKAGGCRAHPPRVVVSPQGNTYTLAPVTLASEWCGEHEPAPTVNAITIPIPADCHPAVAALLLRDALTDFTRKRSDTRAYAEQHATNNGPGFDLEEKIAEVKQRLSWAEACRVLLFDYRTAR